jgi:hypothetical protein
MNPPVESEPWGGRDVLALFSRAGIGVAVMSFAVYQAGTRATPASQAPWATWAVGGLIVLGAANALWLLAARRTVGLRSRLLLEELDALAAASGRPARATSDLVATAAMTRFHHRWCPLASGKPVRPWSRAAHERAGRRPCGVCAP